MVVTTRARNKRKQFMTAEPWPANEMSTRNCYHCLAPREGIYVSCRKGHQLVTVSGKHKWRLVYNGVIRQPRLLKPCQDCTDLDNYWT